MPSHNRALGNSRWAKGIASLVAATLLAMVTGAAQAQNCSQTVAAAIASLEAHCGELARDSVCYGSPHASAYLQSQEPAANFSESGARASAHELASLQTSALDSDSEQWGIAAIHLSANLPQTYEGPGVIILLAGEAAAINDVKPDDVMALHAPVSTAALEGATLYRHPGVIPEAVGSVEAEALLLVDAYEDSGQWLRVVNNGEIAWIEADKATRLNALDSLPKLGLGATFAWQALSLSTGADFPECAEAEPFIAIQTPRGISVSLTINGVDMRLDSMATFQQVHASALSMTVHRGRATTIFGQTVKQSESVIGILATTGDGAATVLDWSGALTGSDDEYARGQRAQAALNGLARANGWPEAEAYNYPASVFHKVRPGETLYGLTAHYETDVALIIAANGGDDSLSLLAGMTLVIPKPGSGFAWRDA